MILVGIDAGLLDDIPALSSALMIALDDRGSICINFFFGGGPGTVSLPGRDAILAASSCP